MRRLCEPIRLLTDDELRLLHEGSLRLLANTGMKFRSHGFLDALDAAGAKVDRNAQVVKFPANLIEATLETVRKQRGIVPQLPLSWHNNFTLADRPSKVTASFGGACLYLHDLDKNVTRATTADDMLTMVRLGEALPDVKSVGNPLMYLRESDGTEVHPKLVALKGAALIAKNCSKPATTQVLTVQELELIIEMGIVLKGSWEEYRKEPFLMSVKEPISPLQLTPEPADVLLAMARKGLPCHITPMPLLGLNVPITPAAGICVVNAEILAIWTAVKAVNPDAPVEASIVSGSMDMRNGKPNFAAPEVILSDMMISQLYERYYHLTCDQGISWIDAKYPGAQAALERVFKLMSSAALGKINYPTGALAGNTVFSPEQAVIDLEIGRAMNRLLDGTEVNAETLCLELIEEVGIGGNFFSHEHTARHFRERLWMPMLLDRTPVACGQPDAEKDILHQANHAWRKALASNTYEIDRERARAIDGIVAKGERILLGD